MLSLTPDSYFRAAACASPLGKVESEFQKPLVGVLNTQHRSIQPSATGAVGERLYSRKLIYSLLD